MNSVNVGLVRTDVGRHSDWKEENPLKIEVRAAAIIRKG